jgi:hypothetical protein
LKLDGYIGEALSKKKNAALFAPLAQFAQAFTDAMIEMAASKASSRLSATQRSDLLKPSTTTGLDERSRTPSTTQSPAGPLSGNGQPSLLAGDASGLGVVGEKECLGRSCTEYRGVIKSQKNRSGPTCVRTLPDVQPRS